MGGSHFVDERGPRLTDHLKIVVYPDPGIVRHLEAANETHGAIGKRFDPLKFHSVQGDPIRVQSIRLPCGTPALHPRNLLTLANRLGQDLHRKRGFWPSSRSSYRFPTFRIGVKDVFVIG